MDLNANGIPWELADWTIAVTVLGALISALLGLWKVTATRRELMSNLGELTDRVINLERKQLNYEDHINDLYRAIRGEPWEIENRILKRLHTVRPAQDKRRTGYE